MAATKYLNRDELFIEQKEAERKERIKKEARHEEEMQEAFRNPNPIQDFYDCVFELMELRKW